MSCFFFWFESCGFQKKPVWITRDPLYSNSSWNQFTFHPSIRSVLREMKTSKRQWSFASGYVRHDYSAATGVIPAQFQSVFPADSFESQVVWTVETETFFEFRLNCKWELQVVSNSILFGRGLYIVRTASWCIHTCGYFLAARKPRLDWSSVFSQPNRTHKINGICVRVCLGVHTCFAMSCSCEKNPRKCEYIHTIKRFLLVDPCGVLSVQS